MNIEYLIALFASFIVQSSLNGQKNHAANHLREVQTIFPLFCNIGDIYNFHLAGVIDFDGLSGTWKTISFPSGHALKALQRVKTQLPINKDLKTSATLF